MKDYKEYNWEVMAHDTNSPYLRNNIFVRNFLRYPKLLGVSTPVFGIVCRQNQIEYICDFPTWGKSHDELAAQVIADYHRFDEIIQKAIDWGESLNAWTENNI